MIVHTHAKTTNILPLLSRAIAGFWDPQLAIPEAVTVAAADPMVGIETHHLKLPETL